MNNRSYFFPALSTISVMRSSRSCRLRSVLYWLALATCFLLMEISPPAASPTSNTAPKIVKLVLSGLVCGLFVPGLGVAVGVGDGVGVGVGVGVGDI